MSSVTVYTFQDAEGSEQTFTTQDPAEAQEHGRRYGFLVIANEYEFSESALAWDFRPKDDEITDEMIDDILCAAFEGGSTHWCPTNVFILGEFPEGAEFASEVVSRGGFLAIPDDPTASGDPRQFEWLPLDRERIENGIRRAASRYRGGVAEFYEKHDAGEADIALQLAIFDEVIYA